MSVEIELSMGSSNEPSCGDHSGEFIQDMKQCLSTYYPYRDTPREVEVNFHLSPDTNLGRALPAETRQPTLARSNRHSCAALTNRHSHTALSNGEMVKGEQRRGHSYVMCEPNSVHRDSSFQPGSVDSTPQCLDSLSQVDMEGTALAVDCGASLADEGSLGSGASLSVEGYIDEAEDFEVTLKAGDTPVVESQPKIPVFHSGHSTAEEGMGRRNSREERDELNQLMDQVQEVPKAGFKLGHLRERKPTPAWLALEDSDRRRLSDPASRIRRDRTRITRIRRQRCVSDSEAPEALAEDDDPHSEGGGSTQGYDSGYNEEVRAKYSNSSSTTWGLLSLDSEGVTHDAPPPKHRRATPHPASMTGAPGGLEDSRSTSLAIARRAKRPLSKHLSCSSMGTSTDSSVWEYECASVGTVTDILSSLGFDDFDSPQLVPDRFIPRDVAHVKPTLMRAQSVSAAVSYSPCDSPELEAVSSTPAHHDLPLGATADNFLTSAPHSASPPPPAQPPVATKPVATKLQHQQSYNLFSPLDPTVYDPAVSQIDRGKIVLETVVEETASDLSPSPRWLSPRVSIDHSVADGKMGYSLTVQKPRKRSLPTREGYKISIGSQVESEPESIYFSVTSYDDKITSHDKDKEDCVPAPVPLPLEDQSPQRRRRRGVYTPPPGLLTWLSTQKSISEEECLNQDPSELPWPFSEQARLRKSLTEIHQAQQSSAAEHTSEGQEADAPAVSTPSPSHRPHPHLPHCHSNTEDLETGDDFHDALPPASAQTQVPHYQSECPRELGSTREAQQSIHRRAGALEEVVDPT